MEKKEYGGGHSYAVKSWTFCTRQQVLFWVIV